MNSSFSTSNPNLQHSWDSTSISALKTCPRKYYYSIVLGYRGSGEAVDLKFGLLYHGAIERYDHWKAEGLEHEQALNNTILWTLQATWDQEFKRPWISTDDNKNRYTLVRTICWYLDEFRDDPCETIILASGKPAVELSFRFETGEVMATGEPLLLCGHLDKVVTFQNATWVMDHKTTKAMLNQYYFEKFTPDDQFSLYTFAAKVAYSIPTHGLIVNGAQVLQNSSRFQRELVQRSETQLDEWYNDTLYYIRMAESFAASNYWPMNVQSCGKYRGCEYRSVCSRPPGSRPAWLAGSFTQNPWDPLKIRGDV